MSELGTRPLRRELHDIVREDEIQRVWSGVVERRARKQLWQRARPVFAVAGVLVAVVAVVVIWFGRAEPTPGLLTADGRAPETLRALKARATELSDGSRIELTSGARLDVLSNDGRSFVTVLREGSARFQVRPGGPRRWTVETGLGTVQVVGTEFSVTRSSGSVEIRVSHGVVLVQSDLLPGRARQLTAGEQLLLRAELESSEPEAKGVGLPDAAANTPVEPSSAGSALPLASQMLPKSPAAATATASPQPREQFMMALALADQARARGDSAGAIGHLRAALAEPLYDARRATTAFTLGKLLLEARRAVEAAEAFTVALDSGPPAALAEDVLVRLVEAEARAGRVERAQAAAARYAQRYPAGSRREEVLQWIEPH